ncbi:MAG: hypothetical protein KAH56_13300, partial [Candidatus Krumholzibacteria bacterium]|nr:hypothetical protein [Candidatus Krumholzibacteria bacterium]
MKSHALVRRLFPIAVWCGLALLAGCSDDDAIIIVVTPDQVRVLDEADGQPVAGIKVVMMDPQANVPVAGPVMSREDGNCPFDIEPSGSHRFLVFGGVDYRVHSLPDYWYGTKGKSAPSPPVTVAEIRVHKVAPDSLPRIAGLIVDASSGTPLGQVFVSLSSYLTGYQGNTSASDDVTVNDGLFSVSQIPFAMDSETGNLDQVNPLLFTRHGYRSIIWSYDPPNGSDNVDISGVTIAMTPIDSGDNGSISGRLMRDGLPAEGIAVGLGVVDLPVTEKAGAGLPGWAAVTDQDGRFTIGELPAGTFYLQPGFPLADGTFYPNQPGNIPRKVDPGQAVDVGDLIVLHEIEPRWPTHGRR